MNTEDLRIAWCYPDILNLHGDRGNVMALAHVADLMGLHADIKRIVNPADPIDFDATDILFFNAGELKSARFLAQELGRNRGGLDGYVEKGGMIVVIGSTIGAFAKSTTLLDGSSYQGLGYLDVTCREREKIYGNDVIFESADYGYEVAGIQISLIDVSLGAAKPLGKTVYGRGNDGTGTEGARERNVVFTNCLGPVLVKNPWFAESLIRDALAVRGASVSKAVEPAKYDIERKSLECIKRYNQEKVGR